MFCLVTSNATRQGLSKGHLFICFIQNLKSAARQIDDGEFVYFKRNYPVETYG